MDKIKSDKNPHDGWPLCKFTFFTKDKPISFSSEAMHCKEMSI